MRTLHHQGDGREQFLPIERLLEPTILTRPVEGRPTQQIWSSGDEYDWQPGSRRLNDSRELETIHEGHRDVRDQAVNVREAATLEERRGRRKQTCFIVGRVQQAFDRLEHPRVIVDDGNDRAAGMVGHGHPGILAERCGDVCNRKL